MEQNFNDIPAQGVGAGGISFDDISVQMAVERAGSSQFLTLVAKDVQEVLRPGEFVLECADTTFPGFHSALAVTNQRILIGVGPAQLQEIPLDNVTRVAVEQAPELTLRLYVYNADLPIYGLGERGLRRMVHALEWLVTSARNAQPAGSEPEHSLVDLYNEWVDLQKFFHDNPDVSDEESNSKLVSVLANKRWW